MGELIFFFTLNKCNILKGIKKEQESYWANPKAKISFVATSCSSGLQGWTDFIYIQRLEWGRQCFLNKVK